MPIIVACPTCGGQLRVADELLGARVRCPACNGTFDATSEPTRSTDAPASDSAPRPREAPLERGAEVPPPPPAPASPFPALEIGSGYREVPVERGAEAPVR